MKNNYAEKFKDLVELEGYVLLSEYINSRIKVKLKCPNKHIYEVTPNNFKKGTRCQKCLNKIQIQSRENFTKTLNQEGYELIGEYINVMVKVKLKCPKGHIYKVAPNNFNHNQRCPKCSNKCPIQAKEQFIELLYEEGYELLSEYKNTQIKVKLKCPNNHEWNVKPNDFKNNKRCPKCAGKCPIQAKEQFIQTLDREGYELLSEYKNNRIKVKLKCPNNHEWNVTPDSFKNNGRRCPHCAGSTGQRLLQEMLLNYDIGKVIYNDREALDGLEIDIYYPELSIGIEYQGNYWHSLPDHTERDKRKKLLCKEKGIKLIEVWDEDFLKNQEKELSKLFDIIIRSYNYIK